MFAGRSWGYKTEIHHPVSKTYYHGGDPHGGGYHVSHYNMPDYHHDYHHKPKYHKYDHYSPPKYHHKEVKIIREPIYIKEYKPPPPPSPPPAPKKKDEDMFNMKFEIPMGKIFDKFEDKEEPKEEPKQPEPDMYGYKKPAPPPPPPKKEKKEIEIKIPKIPKINIDKMFDKEMGGGDVEGEAGADEDRK